MFEFHKKESKGSSGSLQHCPEKVRRMRLADQDDERKVGKRKATLFFSLCAWSKLLRRRIVEENLIWKGTEAMVVKIKENVGKH